MEEKYILIKNEELDRKALESIVALKQQYWNYPIDSQIEWLKNNMRTGDIHILRFDGKELIAYLNLVNLSIVTDGVEKNALGVGNVCVSRERQGQKIGNALMKYANGVICESGKQGLLLCREELIPFYHKAGWKELHDVIVTVNGKPYDRAIMRLGDSEIAHKSLSIDRNF